MPLLQPGIYRISVQAQGFRPISRSGIRLKVAQTAPWTLRSKSERASESITVTETAPLLDAGSNAIGGVVTRRKSRIFPCWGATRMPW